MSGFVEPADHQQVMLLPECLDDYVDEENPVWKIDAFVKMLDLAALGLGTVPEATVVPAIVLSGTSIGRGFVPHVIRAAVILDQFVALRPPAASRAGEKFLEPLDPDSTFHLGK